MVKKILNRFFIDGLTGMSYGLFATLIIGTILQQIGTLISGEIGTYLYQFGKIAAGMTSGVACKFGESPLVVLSSATAGMVGGYSSKILAGTIFTEDGALLLSGPGEPLGAFLAAYIAIEVAHVVSGKTQLDIIITPLTGILTGSAIGLFFGPPISKLMTELGELINWGTEQQPLLMGVIVSVLMGMILTLPISSAALGIILNLSGLAAGAATVGCCCNMVGFGIASYKENGAPGLIAQGLGTSMLQVPNIMRKPLIWLPVILSSAILGPVSTLLFKMTNNATGSGMGTAGLVGLLDAIQVMGNQYWIPLILIDVIAPAILTFSFYKAFRKLNYIRKGDLKIERL